MATSNEGSGNLMDEFEEAFQACLLALTKQEPNTGTNKEEIELEVQKTTNRFIDVARQMEAFFLQKRFLVSTIKPDMLIKDENTDLRIEINRKEALLNKHYNRLEEWKTVLAENKQAHLRQPVAEQITAPGAILQPGTGPRMPMGGPGQQHLQNQLQQQKMMQAQQMQQLRFGKYGPK